MYNLDIKVIIIMVKSFLIISFLLLVLTKSEDHPGVKIAVKQDVIYGFERQFLPLLVEELGKIQIPDTHIDLDVGISTLHILLSEIHFVINNLLVENVEISLNEPNVVNVKANSITGNGNLKVHFKLGFLSETDTVNIQVKNVNVDADAILTTQESSIEPGKLLPSAYVSRINIDIDFDFHLNGSIIAFVANLVHSKIKNYINQEIQTQLKQIIIDESKVFIADLVSQIPVYVPLGYKDMAIDYSLLSVPKISNGYVIVNSNGAIINLRSKSGRDIPYKYADLPDYDINGKSIQMFLSEYSIATAIDTLYESHILEFTLNPEDIPKESPFQLDTTSLSILINGMSDVYGKGKKVRLYVNVTEIPHFEITKSLVNTSVVTELTFNVQLDSGEWEEALKFSTTGLASGDAIVQTQGQISGHIHTLQLTQSKLIATKIEKANVENIEVVFNFSSKLLIPVLNENFLKNITIKLPTLEGISFEDSTVDIPGEYLEMNLNPTFGNMVKNYLVRRSKSILNNLESLFLN